MCTQSAPGSPFLRSSVRHVRSLCSPLKSNSRFKGLESELVWRPACHIEVTALNLLETFSLYKTGRTTLGPRVDSLSEQLPLTQKLTRPCRGPATPHLDPLGPPVRFHPTPTPESTGRREVRRWGSREVGGDRCRSGPAERGAWESCGGAGRSSSNSDPRDPLRPGTESTRSVPAPSRRGPPFTYELAHGGRVWVPVTLPERHGSAGSRPGPPTPRLTTPPARPWLRPPGRTSPGRCEAPGSGLGPWGGLRRERRRGRAHAHLPRAAEPAGRPWGHRWGRVTRWRIMPLTGRGAVLLCASCSPL